MRIAVTGASGHLGTNLIRSLIARGITPRVLVHKDAHTFKHIAVEQTLGDVRDRESLKQCFTGADIVYHLAAKISIGNANDAEIRAVNVDGTRNVINACLQCNVRRLVHISSIHAFDQHPVSQPIDENRLLISKGYPYDRSKADAVREVEAAVQRGLDAVTIFPTGLIGPYDFNLSHMGKFFLDLYHGKIPVLIKGGYNFVDIRDTTDGIIAAGERGRKGERYLLGGYYVTVRCFAELVEEITGKKTPKLFLPIPLIKSISPFVMLFAHLTGKNSLKQSAAPGTLEILKSHSNVSSAKAARELGFRPRPTRETVEAVYTWFREVGYIES